MEVVVAGADEVVEAATDEVSAAAEVTAVLGTPAAAEDAASDPVDTAEAHGVEAAADETAGEETATDEVEDLTGVGPVVGLLTTTWQDCLQAEGKKQFQSEPHEQVAGVHLTETGEVPVTRPPHPAGNLCGGLQVDGREALGFPPLQTLSLDLLAPEHRTTSPPSQRGYLSASSLVMQ